MTRRLSVLLLFSFLLVGSTPLRANSNNLKETLAAVIGIFFQAGGVLNVGLAGGQELSLINDYRRNLDLDELEYRGRSASGGNEKPKAGGPEVALGFDWNKYFILYSGRHFVGNINTTVYHAAPPFQSLNVRTTSYKDAGLNPRDLIFGTRFYLGNHVIQLHGGLRNMVEDASFTERNAPLAPTSISQITDSASNRFKARTSGPLLSAGYRYEFSVFHLFAEISAFQLKGSYSAKIAAFESLGSTSIRELSVDEGRINGLGGEAVLGVALGKRFGPRLGVRRTVVRMNFHRRLYAVFDSTRSLADTTAQAIYLGRVRNKRGVSLAGNAAFIEMRFAADFGPKKTDEP